MKRTLFALMTIFFLAACSPSAEQTDDDRDHMMDDDMMEGEEHMMDDDEMIDGEEMHEDDSLSNRDMMSSMHLMTKMKSS